MWQRTGAGIRLRASSDRCWIFNASGGATASSRANSRFGGLVAQHVAVLPCCTSASRGLPTGKHEWLTRRPCGRIQMLVVGMQSWWPSRSARVQAGGPGREVRNGKVPRPCERVAAAASTFQGSCPSWTCPRWIDRAGGRPGDARDTCGPSAPDPTELNDGTGFYPWAPDMI
jgi:hypothetical protein